MTVTHYSSADTGAPVLSGSAGSLLTLLDAVLVNGYGSQSAAGWTIAYTGTNQRVYAPAAGGSGCTIYINDNGPGAATYSEARVTGFKTATALGVGSGQFPSTSQVTSPSGALVIRKSTTVSSTARNWTIIANGQTVYLFVETGDNLAGVVTAYPFMFGDFFSYSSSDLSNAMIIGRNAENTNSHNYDPLATMASGGDNTTTVNFGQFVAASWTNVGGSVPFGKMVDNQLMGVSTVVGQSTTSLTGSNGVAIGRNYFYPANFPYPNGPDGALWLSPVRIVHSNSVRGYLKGVWAPLHDRPLNHGDTFSVASGNLSGKSFIIQNIPAGASNAMIAGQVAIEISNTWN